MTILQRLENFPQFKDLSQGSKDLINHHAIWKSYAAKEQLIQKGNEIAGVYLIQKGALRVYGMNEKGNETTFYWVNPGESCVLAMNCIFSKLLYPAWVDSEAQGVEMVIIPPGIYRELFSTESLIQEFTFNVLSSTIFELLTTLEEFVSKNILKRLAIFLIKKANDKKTVFLGHDEIANHLGTVREVISRACCQLQGRGLICVKRKEITLLNIDGLTNL